MQKAFRYQENSSSFKYYWEKGAGKELLKKLAFQPDLMQADALYPYLFEVDELTDDLVQDIHQQYGFAKGRSYIKQYLAQPEQVPTTIKERIDRYFHAIEQYPAWLDWDLIQSGIEISQRAGISGLIVLRDYCLMGGYESAAINKPLIYTGALKKGAAKRLTETVEFWVNITGNQALKPQGIGFESIIDTRIIHAFSRVNILQSTDWDTEKWGLPINQWDMLATNLGFSLVFLVGLRRMGIEPTDTEVRGIFHLWKYIGFLLGIPLALLPDQEEQAILSLYYWTMTQAAGDADSKLLAKALQEEPIEAFYPPSKMGRKFMREVHLYYNHYLLGDYSCNLLQLDQTWIGKIAHLNILKNKYAAKKMHLPSERQEAIRKGRQSHEQVKQIYLTYNAKVRKRN